MKKILSIILANLLFVSSVFADGIVHLSPQADSGLSIFRSLDVGTTDAAVKAAPGNMYGWHLFNAAATTRYFKFYNGLIANVTVGTTTPVLTVPIPAGSAANVEFTNGITFTTAITIACTTGLADNNSGAPTANDCVANVFYK